MISITLIILSSLLVLLHLLVLAKVIPYQFLWAGRIKTDQEMVRFESVSLVMSLFFVLIYLAQAHFIPVQLPPLWLKVTLWIMAAFFLLNTFGNLASKNKIEKFFFAPLTILMTVLNVLLAMS